MPQRHPAGCTGGTALASEPPAKQADLENLLAHKIELVRPHQLVLSAEYIARLVKNFDGAGEYAPLVKAAIATVQDQVDHIQADQEDREGLARSYAEMLGVITAGHAQLRGGNVGSSRQCGHWRADHGSG